MFKKVLMVLGLGLSLSTHTLHAGDEAGVQLRFAIEYSPEAVESFLYNLENYEQLNGNDRLDIAAVRNAIVVNDVVTNDEAAAEAFFRLVTKYKKHAIQADASTTKSFIGKCGSYLHLASIAGVSIVSWYLGYVPAQEVAFTLLVAYQCHRLAGYSDNRTQRWLGTFGLIGIFVAGEYRFIKGLTSN